MATALKESGVVLTHQYIADEVMATLDVPLTWGTGDRHLKIATAATDYVVGWLRSYATAIGDTIAVADVEGSDITMIAGATTFAPGAYLKLETGAVTKLDPFTPSPIAAGSNVMGQAIALQTWPGSGKLFLGRIHRGLVAIA